MDASIALLSTRGSALTVANSLPQAISAYSFTTLAWLSAQALPLITWPTFISSLLTPDYQHANRKKVLPNRLIDGQD